MTDVTEQEIDLFGGVESERQKIDRAELAGFIYEIMSKMSLREFISCMTNKYVEAIEYMRLCAGERACQKTSLLFNPHRFDTKSKISKASIYSSLKDKAFMSGFARVILCKNKKYRSDLYQMFSFGVNGIYYICEFQPYIARDVAKAFGVTLESKVLDPCAGWGGRMLGISSICNSYTCFDPSTKTYEGLLQLDDFIAKFRKDFSPMINNECFEDCELPGNYFDFAITSPPYYDTEEYSDEETNSLNRYKTFDDWRDGFYIPMIHKTMDALKENATFALNIGSRKYPLNQILKDNFSFYKITKDENYFSGKEGALGRKGEGETFYYITKG